MYGVYTVHLFEFFVLKQILYFRLVDGFARKMACMIKQRENLVNLYLSDVFKTTSKQQKTLKTNYAYFYEIDQTEEESLIKEKAGPEKAFIDSDCKIKEFKIDWKNACNRSKVNNENDVKMLIKLYKCRFDENIFDETLFSGLINDENQECIGLF